MVNTNKLKGRIVESGIKIPLLAEKMGIDRATLYRKIKKGEFTIREAEKISKELNLTIQEVNSIFFDQYVA